MVDRAKDDSYGWVLVFACFTTGLMIVDSSGSFGIFMIECVERKLLSEILVTLIGACRLTLAGLTGIVLGGIAQKYEHQKVMITGTLLVFVGHSGCAIGPHLGFVWIFLTYGLISSLGFGCYSIVFATAFQSYFRKRLGLANAIVSTGFSCGIFFWPPVLEAFLSHYGWTGGLLMDAAIHLHGFALAMLMVPRMQQNPTCEKKNINHETEFTNVKGVDTGMIKCSRDQSRSRYLFSSSPELYHQLSDSVEDTGSHFFHSFPKRFDRLSLEYFKDQDKDKKHTRDCETDIAKNTEYLIQKGHLKLKTESNNKAKCMDIFTNCFTLKDIVDFSLLRDIPFLMYCLGIALVQGGALAPIILLPVRAVETGVSKVRAAFLVSILGIATGIFKLPWGFAADIKKFSIYKPLLCGMPAVMSGITSFISCAANEYWSLSLLSCIWGILSAGYSSLQYAIVVHLLNGSNISKGAGIIHTLLGVTMTLCLVSSGILMEISGSAVLPFYVLGAVQLVGGLLITAIPFVQRRRNQQMTQD